MDTLSKIVEKFLNDFKRVGKKEKIFIFFILLAMFVFGFFGSSIYQKLSYKKNMEPVLLIPTPTQIPKNVSLKLEVENTQVSPGQTFSSVVLIDSKNQGVDAADFVVNFDPDYLRVATASGGNFFKIYPQEKIEDGCVKISGVAVFEKNTFLIPKGQGITAEIMFEALNATDSTKISLDRKQTIVASQGQDIWDKENTQDVDINISW